TQFLKGFLLLRGFEIHVSNSGLEALERLKKETFDLLLLDIGLPDLNGIEILKSLKPLNPSQKTVVITGHGKEYDEELKSLGIAHILQKPLGLSILLDKIKELLGS
ncbi:MAG: response regulator, partial [Candidatus Omnitrophica bacterium]|nr:response regulator [Candidatus Omnitrophota bacterium]